MTSSFRHPVNRKMAEHTSSGERIAVSLTRFIGSWRFLVLQTIIVAIWILGNVWLVFHFDPYPFILLNLAFSTQAAYAAPLILLASNRGAARDRLTLEHAASQADHEERQNDEILANLQGLGDGTAEVLRQLARNDARLAELERAIAEAVARNRRAGG